MPYSCLYCLWTLSRLFSNCFLNAKLPTRYTAQAYGADSEHAYRSLHGRSKPDKKEEHLHLMNLDGKKRYNTRRQRRSCKSIKSIVMYWTTRDIFMHGTPFMSLHLRDHQPSVTLSSVVHPRKGQEQNMNIPVANPRLVP